MEIIRPIIEIVILFLIFYLVLLSLRGTRGAGIFKGALFVFMVLFLSAVMVTRKLEFHVIHYILREWFLPFIAIALIIIFYPELRRALLKLGQSRLFNPFFRVRFHVVEEIIEAVFKLTQKNQGALIAIEREVGLKPYIEGGVRLDAEVNSNLIQTIFYPGTILHDGAIIIKEDRLVAAGCLFPLTDNPDVARALGTRHRAGIGITEESDAVVIIVSEETGQVSVGLKGYLTRDVTKERLREILEGLYLKEEKSLPARPETREKKPGTSHEEVTT